MENEEIERSMHAYYEREGGECQCAPCVKARYGGRWPTMQEAMQVANRNYWRRTIRRILLPFSGGAR